MEQMIGQDHVVHLELKRGELIKGIEMILEIILRKREIPYRSIQLSFVHLSSALVGLSGTTIFRVPWGQGGLPISSYWLLKMRCLILLGLVIGKSWVFMNTGGDLMDIVRPFLGSGNGMNPGSGGGGPSDSVILPFSQEGQNHDKDAGSPDWEDLQPIQEFPTLEGGGFDERETVSLLGILPEFKSRVFSTMDRLTFDLSRKELKLMIVNVGESGIIVLRLGIYNNNNRSFSKSSIPTLLSGAEPALELLPD
ncbi:hypothetical protein ACET3Z_004919 [Daucus carota]